jgi:hypothetical protein
MTLQQLAKEFNDLIIKQEGYDPVGEEWILREFNNFLKANNCGNCFYWQKKGLSYKTGEQIGACLKMRDCFCCNYDRQISGAIGGGHFESKAIFYCNMWRIDSRANR